MKCPFCPIDQQYEFKDLRGLTNHVRIAHAKQYAKWRTTGSQPAGRDIVVEPVEKITLEPLPTPPWEAPPTPVPPPPNSVRQHLDAAQAALNARREQIVGELERMHGLESELVDIDRQRHALTIALGAFEPGEPGEPPKALTA